MILVLAFLSLFSFADTTSTDEKVVGIFYYTEIFGHIHQSGARNSASLTTIQCSHPVKVMESSKVQVSGEWAYVQVAEHKGFVLKAYLSDKRPDCFQGKYPKFFDAMNLDLAELYYWGRLYDQYISGETRMH